MKSRLLVLLLGSVAGCCNIGQRSNYLSGTPVVTAPCGSCAAPAPVASGFVPAAPSAPAPASPLPPGPAAPPPIAPAAPPATFTPAAPDVPPAPLADAGVRLSAPEPLDGASSTESPSWPRADSRYERPPQAPPVPRAQTPEPPIASIPPQKEPAPPPPAEDRNATPPLPVDIPQFAMARPRVASGQTPFPDGLAWLQAHGYRTVLHVRAPGSDDAAARRQVEKYNLRYLTLEVSPQTLSKEVVEQFNRLVTDEANLPLFVYDRDGSLAGGLWYLYYRLADGQDDEHARTAAARLGFRPDQEGNQRTMWLALQSFLAAQKP